MPRAAHPGKHAARHRATSTPLLRGGSGPIRVAALAAPLATAAVVGMGVLANGGPAGSAAPGGAASVSLAEAAPTPPPAAADPVAPAPRVSATAAGSASRSMSISRSLNRASRTDWATTDLNVYAAPSAHARRLGELASGSRLSATGRASGAFSEIVVQGKARWVHTHYVSDTKPVDPASMGLVLEPCAATASVEHGLVTNALHAWEAVCNAFPQVRTYGGLGNRPEHDTGHAIDVMVYGDSALGYRIAQFVQAHAAQLDLYDLIYRQHIWTPVRASEGWRLMPDRGSATANHMDHVHIGVN